MRCLISLTEGYFSLNRGIDRWIAKASWVEAQQFISIHTTTTTVPVNDRVCALKACEIRGQHQLHLQHRWQTRSIQTRLWPPLSTHSLQMRMNVNMLELRAHLCWKHAGSDLIVHQASIIQEGDSRHKDALCSVEKYGTTIQKPALTCSLVPKRKRKKEKQKAKYRIFDANHSFPVCLCRNSWHCLLRALSGV